MAFVVKNTFVELEEPPTSPPGPPTKTAPGKVQDGSFHVRTQNVVQVQAVEAQQAVPRRRHLFRRVFFRQEDPSPTSGGQIPQKNTFIHFQAPSSPSAAQPPSTSLPVAPGTAVAPPMSTDRSVPTSSSKTQYTTVRTPKVVYPSTPRDSTDNFQMVYCQTSPAPMPVATGQAPPTMSTFAVPSSSPYPVTTATTAAPQMVMPAQYVLLPSQQSPVLIQQQSAVSQQASSPPRQHVQAANELSSLGAEGHASGQCIPCLMQVRWRAGRCKEPCRFGSQCGRCHEPHTEEELQKIQAKMRKEKKKSGAVGAALLSAAYAAGHAAPIGAGATRTHL